MPDFNVSVIIPTYNRRELLDRALRSVFSQTLLPGELIVIDDGSTDGSSEFVSEAWPQVKLITQSNQGVSAARNRGIVAAQGNWIALLDSDDEWLPTKLEAQYKVLQNNPEAKVCHTEEVWVRNGVRVNQMKKHKKYGGMIFEHCLPLCAMSPSSIVLHRSMFDEVGMFKEDLPACEDYDLWLRICARFPVEYVEQPQIVKYGGHKDQLSQRYWGMDRFRIRALVDLLDDEFLIAEHREQAIEMLRKKIDVFVKGAAKRGKQEEVKYYLDLKGKYI